MTDLGGLVDQDVTFDDDKMVNWQVREDQVDLVAHHDR